MVNNGLIEWKPISTAPKTGEAVLLLAGGVIEGYWCIWDGWSQVIAGTSHDLNYPPLISKPTHWAPIPWQTFE